jgi:hypothetical protein
MKTAGKPLGPEFSELDWLAKADELKRVAVDRLTVMPLSQRSAVTMPGAWSASDVVEHLILFEEMIPGLWSESLLSIPSPKVTLGSELLSRMLSFSVSKTGIRIPTLPELESKGGMELAAIASRWSEARSGLVVALPKNPNAPWVLHPALGPLSSAQMGRILAAHIEHHLRHWPTQNSKQS